MCRQNLLHLVSLVKPGHQIWANPFGSLKKEFRGHTHRVTHMITILLMPTSAVRIGIYNSSPQAVGMPTSTPMALVFSISWWGSEPDNALAWALSELIDVLIPKDRHNWKHQSLKTMCWIRLESFYILQAPFLGVRSVSLVLLITYEQSLWILRWISGLCLCIYYHLGCSWDQTMVLFSPSLTQPSHMDRWSLINSNRGRCVDEIWGRSEDFPLEKCCFSVGQGVLLTLLVDLTSNPVGSEGEIVFLGPLPRSSQIQGYLQAILMHFPKRWSLCMSQKCLLVEIWRVGRQMFWWMGRGRDSPAPTCMERT